MYVVTVEFRITAGEMDRFLPMMRDNARASLAEEEGCQVFDVCRDPADPDAVFLYEVYTDEAAFQAHLASPHFKRFDAAAAALVADKQVRILNRL
jgi:quinol monooxygenase YgiN